MAVLADFTVLNQFNSSQTQNGTFEKPYVIGNTGSRFEHTFNTGGRHHSAGLLVLMVRHLIAGSSRVAIKRKGGHEVNLGRLQPSTAADRDMWRQQQFIIETNTLSAGNGNDNTLIIGRVRDNSPNGFDEFQVRDIVVFFHQAR